MKNSLLLAVALSAFIALPGFAQTAPGSDNPVRDIVAKHEAVFNAPPKRFPSNNSTDAPLLGNGDLLVAIAGAPEKLQFRLSKADLWELRPGGVPRALGCLVVECPGQSGATWQATQNLARATTTGTFSKDGKTLRVESFVAATENTLIVKLEAEGGEITGTLRLVAGDAKETPAVTEGGVLVVERRIEKNMTRPSGAVCAIVPPSPDGSFKVAPGTPLILKLCAGGLANGPDYRADAVKRATNSGAVTALRAAHEVWWADFWKKSFIEIPDKALEQRYYLSHYCMGSASRLAHFPPGLYGWTLHPGIPLWGGQYYNNYNFFAPFYGLYAANHLEQAAPCNDGVLDALELGRAWALRTCGFDSGILLPVNMNPYGIEAGGITHRQRSNAAYACVPLASTWYATYDTGFAKRAYPFVREVAIFWERYLVLENGRYVDKGDAVCEEMGHPANVPVPSDDINPVQSLALIRQALTLALDMSATLGVDRERHEKWNHILAHLSDYPTCTVGDLPKGSRVQLPKTPETRALPIFRYTESGRAWQNDNAVGIQHIFPGNGIGLGVRPDLLDRARNQIKVMGRWIDLNGCNSFYPAAVRVGHDPDDILKNLRHWVDTASPNGMRADNKHGTEQFSVVPSTLQEMLLQSFDGTLRLFPNWPKDKDARFGTLRARGAFLVSAQLKSGVVSGVTIFSEKGRDCVVSNPWPGKKVRVTRNAAAAETVSGEHFTLKTKEDETLTIAPLP
jgi:alpha-L-fucosidase 2